MTQIDAHYSTSLQNGKDTGTCSSGKASWRSSQVRKVTNKKFHPTYMSFAHNYFFSCNNIVNVKDQKIYIC